MKGLDRRLRNLQQRLGPREELIAVIVVGLLAASGLAFTLITNQGTPAGEALAYMAAVDRADTNYVWSHSIIDSSKASSADVSLLDRGALVAQLAAGAHTRSGFTVQGVSDTSSGVMATVSYSTSAGRQTRNLAMRGESPHSWPVRIEPAGLDINVPTGAGALGIDGQAIAASPGTELKVAVFPGTHQMTLAATQLYSAYKGAADAESALPALTAVSFAKVELTGGAATAAEKVVSEAIKACAGADVLFPSGCPQQYRQDVSSGTASWTLLGDPMAGAAAGLDDKSELVVSGRFLMQLSYGSELTHRTRVLAVGGPYLAALAWDGQAFKVTGFPDATAVPALPRPAATDMQVLDAVKAEFDACLKLQGGEALGCPQRVISLYGANFVWHTNGDPMQGAVVGWDGGRGTFSVTGNFDFSVDYDSTPPNSPTRHYTDHSSGHYVADLYWDGSTIVFIGLES